MDLFLIKKIKLKMHGTISALTTAHGMHDQTKNQNTNRGGGDSMR